MVKDPHDLIQNLACRLTDSKEFDSNEPWDIAPPNWSCPVCKRSKIHIARVNNSNILQGHLHNHHDHISEYAKNSTKSILYSHASDQEISTREKWFILKKIGSFLDRFEKILICQDCNYADVKAKSITKDICQYFSYTPNEIAYFIEPEVHRSHSIDEKKVEEINSNLGDIHNYRKSLCDILISRLIINERIWGNPQMAPALSHYKAANSILYNPKLYDGANLLNLKHESDVNLRWFSIALERYEKNKHDGYSSYKSKADYRTPESIEKAKTRKEETAKKIQDGTYFNQGKMWRDSDLKILADDFQNGKSFSDLSMKFGRDERGIKRRLRKMGFILE